jgi:phage gp36-like protein
MMDTNDKNITLEEAQAVIRAQIATRVQQCAQAIQSVLQQHGCNMVVQQTITQDGRIIGNIAIIPREGDDG